MNIQIGTSQYEFSHGRRPSGRGFWMFRVKRIEEGKIREEIMNGESNQTYREACQTVRSKIKEKIINCGWNIKSVQVGS